MRIFVYGFGPYGNYHENITEKIIHQLKPRDDLIKVIFPAMFDRKRFIKNVEEVKPNAILGLGQYFKGHTIRIEQRARNAWRESKSSQLQLIIPGKAEFLKTTAHLKETAESTLSTKAGTYICNFSMYVLLDYFHSHPIPFAFLHIPQSFDIASAIAFVETKLDELELGKKIP